jgi:hypothetical protein
MRDDHEPSAESHAELQAAEKALERGDLAGAQQHLNLAIQHRAPHSQTARLSVAIQTAALAQGRRGRSGGWGGFAVGILGYLFLSLQQPLGWGLPLWGFLAFVLVPAVAGVVVGRSHRAAGTPGQSFRIAAKSVAKAMGLYTALHLLLIGGPHSAGADSVQEFLAGLLSTLLFALIAGLVAGAVSATVAGVGVKEPQI